jgi:trigger factor
MQVTETLSEGLKREYKVVLPKAELGERAEKRLATLKDQTTLKGFRPGKVPLPHLKRVYGRSVMGEVIQEAINEANGKIVKDGGFRLALEPRITLPEESEAVKEAVEGRADLTFTVALEVLPKVELADFKGIKVTRPVVEPTDSEIDEAIQRIAEGNRVYQVKDGAAQKGDRIVIDFKGSIDGTPFEGGAAEDAPLVLGSNSFIPGFEDQLLGAKAGDQRTIAVTFPETYGAKHLAGKPATFETTVKTIEQPAEIRIDDDFAKSLGIDTLAKLKEQVRDRLARDYAAQVRVKVKRQLLDALDKAHQFEVPPTLIEHEFESIWRQLTGDLKAQNKTFADEDTTEDKASEEYRKIAERRVRLGLVIAEIGEKNAIKVSDEELSRAVVERARQFPGQEQQIWNHFRQNPEAIAGLRAPLFEEKVVDFLLELVKVTDKKVDKKDLLAEDESATGG